MTQLSTKEYFSQDGVKNKFNELLGKRSASFITSVLQIVSQNEMLSRCDPQSVFQSAAVAATLDLPINNNLGFAYIVPYKQRDKQGNYVDVAQFQMGYKGFIQLCLRSGQFKTISATPIYEGQLVSKDPLRGFEFDFNVSSEKVIGYASYFSLINGFEKTFYMPIEKLEDHGKKFSQTFKKGFGLWKDDFEGMAMKTVLKLLLSKFAPMSIEMQKAVISDQAVIVDYNDDSIEYVDNKPIEVDKEGERIELLINQANTIEQLKELKQHVKSGQKDLFETKMKEVGNV